MLIICSKHLVDLMHFILVPSLKQGYCYMQWFCKA